MGPATVLMSEISAADPSLSRRQMTLLFLSGGIIAVAGNIFAGRMSDRFGRKRIVLFCAATSAAAYAVFYSGVGGWVLPASWMLGCSDFWPAMRCWRDWPSKSFRPPIAPRFRACAISSSSCRAPLALRWKACSMTASAHTARAMRDIALAAMPIALIAYSDAARTGRAQPGRHQRRPCPMMAVFGALLPVFLIIALAAHSASCGLSVGRPRGRAWSGRPISSSFRCSCSTRWQWRISQASMCGRWPIALLCGIATMAVVLALCACR